MWLWNWCQIGAFTAHLTRLYSFQKSQNQCQLSHALSYGPCYIWIEAMDVASAIDRLSKELVHYSFGSAAVIVNRYMSIWYSNYITRPNKTFKAMIILWGLIHYVFYVETCSLECGQEKVWISRRVCSWRCTNFPATQLITPLSTERHCPMIDFLGIMSLFFSLWQDDNTCGPT